MKYILSVFILGIAFALHGENFTLSSTSFKNGGEIPAKFAMKSVAGGKNISPQLSWNGKEDVLAKAEIRGYFSR